MVSHVGDRLRRAPAREIALAVRDVSHSFRLRGAPLPVLEHIDFTVDRGDFVALLGPSGCGKSTLLRMVAGLEIPSAGVIEAHGRKVAGPDPSRLIVFQDPTLFPWRNVWDNVALGLEAQKRLDKERGRVDATLGRVGLGGFAAAYPHQLSGGMAQRVALARALVNDPELLVLDEPLGRLDSLTRIAMQGEILRLWREAGFTCLLVTHDIEEALLMATRVIVLSQRPARITAIVDVERPYPRHRDDVRLVALRRDMLALLGLEASW